MSIAVFIVACKPFAEAGNPWKKWYPYNTGKTISHLDKKGQPVSEQKFHQLIDYSQNIDAWLEGDTMIIGRIVGRDRAYELSHLQHKKIRNYIETRSGEKTKKYILLHIHEVVMCGGVSSQRQHDYTSRNEAYQRQLHTIDAVTEVHVVPGRAHEDVKEGRRLIIDDEGLIESIFFQLKTRCGAFAVIHPSGTTYLHYGETHLGHILQTFRELKHGEQSTSQ